MFAGNQHTALLHDVGGKTARISGCQHGIQSRIFQHLNTGFFIALRSRGLPGQQTQLAGCRRNGTAGRGAGSPGTDVLGAVAQRFAGFFADLFCRSAPVDVLADVFGYITGRRTFARVDEFRLEARTGFLPSSARSSRMANLRSSAVRVRRSFLRMKHSMCQCTVPS